MAQKDKKQKIIELIKKGMAAEDIKKALLKKKIEAEDSEIELECLRIKAKAKFSNPDKMFFSASTLRFSTPEIVANYRAERISGKIIADLCCGIGSQSIAFAKKFSKVYAVDNDPEKIEMAKKNAEAFGIKNIEFICADLFDEQTPSKIPDADCIFCDPERAPAEKERKIEAIPFVELLLSRYSKITKNICIELPPQITPEKIDMKKYECEKEYLSLKGKLNRLDIYFGRLKRVERSAVLLPEGIILESKNAHFEEKTSEVLDYLYEINPAVEKAGLIGEAAEKFEGKIFACFRSKRSYFFTSHESIESPFFERYRVIVKCANSIPAIISELRNLSAGRTVLRGSVDPQEYWAIRNSIEQKLSGRREFQVFLMGETAAICRPI
ncbi:MAG: methyltransferase domain-containing protein [Candidatus Woesearchaeota archaeon]|nr:methyltransferase domain-containing protein [Candidatus Woesearchaeota archaeon]